MRPARLAVTLVAHGSRDPRAAAATQALALAVGAARPDWEVSASYLDHSLPRPARVLGALDAAGHRRAVLVPLLLTAAYHSKADIPRVLARTPLPRVSYGATLGPHPLLLDALDRRLAEADPGAYRDPARTAVVLAAAGSSDPEANATIARMAARWQARTGWLAVRPAYASAAEPSPAAAVADLLRDGAPRVVVATYLLAPGFFADRIRRTALAGGAAAVSPSLGACAEVADVMLDRFTQTRSTRRSAA